MLVKIHSTLYMWITCQIQKEQYTALVVFLSALPQELFWRSTFLGQSSWRSRIRLTFCRFGYYQILYISLCHFKLIFSTSVRQLYFKIILQGYWVIMLIDNRIKTLGPTVTLIDQLRWQDHILECASPPGAWEQTVWPESNYPFPYSSATKTSCYVAISQNYQLKLLLMKQTFRKVKQFSCHLKKKKFIPISKAAFTHPNTNVLRQKSSQWCNLMQQIQLKARVGIHKSS